MIDPVELHIENALDKLFTDINKEYKLKFGDISPEESLELEEVAVKLEKIVNRYIKNNQ